MLSFICSHLRINKPRRRGSRFYGPELREMMAALAQRLGAIYA
jgi:hypothetical protein